MKILMWLLGGLVGLLSVLLISQWIASESGEVVVLTTRDAAGEAQQTRVWIVEHEGHPWLRAGAEVQRWYRRLEARPEIELERGGATAAYTAIPQPGERDVINDLMLRKYGWADQYIALLFGRDDAVPIRLDPRPGAD